MTPSSTRSPERHESGSCPPSGHLEFPESGAALFRTDNGLEVIVKEDHGAPLVSAQVWVRTGSIYEDDLLGTGVSHLVEHMVFQGAGERGPGELARAIQDTGGYLNAYTSFDRTVYWVDTLKEGLDTALSVLSDLTTRAWFPEAEFGKETDVIRREIDLALDDPGRTLNHLLFETVFRQHPYREPVIGRLHLFNQLTRADAVGYFRRHYQPARMFLVVTGDTTVAEVREMAERWFGTAVNRPHAPVTIPEEPPQTGMRQTHIEFTTGVTHAELAWRIPGLFHADAPALDVLGILVGSGRSSRLHREIQERRRLVHNIGAGAWTPAGAGLFYVSIECDPERRLEAEQAVLDLLGEIGRSGVTEQEVAGARRRFLADQLHGLTTMRGQASDLGSSWLAAGNLNFTRDYLAAVDRVTPDDIVRVARQWLQTDSLTSVSINPKGSLAAKPAGRRTTRPEPIRRHVFPNGLTLLVREDPRLPLVDMHAVLRGGLLAECPRINGAGQLMARTILKGTTTLPADEIATRIEGPGGHISADSGGSSFSVSAHCLEPEWRDAMSLWADVLLHPAFPETETEHEAARQIAAIRQEEDHPSFVAFRALRRAAYGCHPFAMARNGTIESVGALRSFDLAAHHELLTTAGNTVLAVFGNVRFDEVRDQVAQAFASIPDGPRREPEKSLIIPEWEGRECLLPSEKRQAFLVIGFPAVDLRHPDRLALDLIDEACSDMASRLFERIRETHGLAYSVGTTQILGMTRGVFAFHLSTAPDKLEFARHELLSEIRSLAADGLTPEELDRARHTWAGKQVMQRQSSHGLARQTALDELYGLGFDHEEKVLERVRDIPLDAVNDVASRYFAAQAPIIVAVTPYA